MREAVRFAAKFLFSFVYFASFCLVLAGVAWIGDATMAPPKSGWQSTYVDDVGSLALVLLGSLALVAVNWSFVRLEGISQPTILDHIRRCCIFYLALIFLSWAVVQDYLASLEPMYRQEVATPTIGTLLIVGCPIVIDMSILLLWRRRSIHTNTRSLA